MPIYDYECRDCGAEVSDVFQKVTDPELTTCPLCNEEGLFRIVTGGLHGFMAGGETLGSVADRNTKKNKNKINEIESMKRESQPTKEKPWYMKNRTKSNKEIKSLNHEQKIKYIMEGR